MAKKLEQSIELIGKVKSSEKTYLKKTLCQLKGLPSTKSRKNPECINETINIIDRIVEDVSYKVEGKYPLKNSSRLYSIVWRECLEMICPKEGKGILGF